MKRLLIVLAAVVTLAVGGVVLVGASFAHAKILGARTAPATAKNVHLACQFGGLAAKGIPGGVVGAVERRDKVQGSALEFGLLTVPPNLKASTTEMFAYLNGSALVTQAQALTDARQLTQWLDSCHPGYLHPAQAGR